MSEQFGLKYECKCGHKWTPKVVNPAACPRCKRRKWAKQMWETEKYNFLQVCVSKPDHFPHKILCLLKGTSIFCFISMSEMSMTFDRLVENLAEKADYKIERAIHE